MTGRSFPEGWSVTWPESDSPSAHQMSAMTTDEPAQDGSSSIDTQQLQQQLQDQLTQQPQQDPPRKRMYSDFHFLISPYRLIIPAKAPSVRRACVACHTGKTRCSEVLPCQVRFFLCFQSFDQPITVSASSRAVSSAV